MLKKQLIRSLILLNLLLLALTSVAYSETARDKYMLAEREYKKLRHSKKK